MFQGFSQLRNCFIMINYLCLCINLYTLRTFLFNQILFKRMQSTQSFKPKEKNLNAFFELVFSYTEKIYVLCLLIDICNFRSLK